MTDEADDSAALRRWLILGSRRYKPVVLFLYVTDMEEDPYAFRHVLPSDAMRAEYAHNRFGEKCISYQEWHHDAVDDPPELGETAIAELRESSPKPFLLQVIEHNTTQPYPWWEGLAERYLATIEYTENALRTSISLIAGTMRASMPVK